MDFEIRTVEERDVTQLAALIRRLGWFSSLEGENEDVTTARILDHVRMCLADDSHTLLVATDPEQSIVAYVSVHWLPYLFLKGPEGYVSQLFVDERVRGDGVGSELLDRVIAEARRRGCARLMLVAVKSRESYQRGFYPKRGWIEREDMANFIYEL